MVAVKRLMSPITPLIWRIASTACAVEPWIAPICVAISSVALAVWLASVFTSEATTAKPRPGFARARRLDGGVEREQVGLLRDGADELDHVADAARAARELADQLVGVLRDLGSRARPRRSPGVA